MSALVRDNRNSVMKDDFDHWEKLGLNRGFEAYVQQTRTATAPADPAVREGWLKEMRAEYAARRGRGAARSRNGTATRRLLRPAGRSSAPCRRPSTRPRPRG